MNLIDNWKEDFKTYINTLDLMKDDYNGIMEYIDEVPSVEPERKKMSNKEWVDFLSEQFTVSRTSAKEMLHAMMSVKKEDNFKKQFLGGRNEKG